MVAPQLLFRQRPDWGEGGGVRPRTDGQINETAGSLLKRSHVITVHQTDRALKLSPLSLWSRRERDKTQTDWLVKGFKCQNFHRPQLEWICRSARRTGSGGGGGGGRRGGGGLQFTLNTMTVALVTSRRTRRRSTGSSITSYTFN